MAAESDDDSRLEIAHVLFMDIVGYSKLPIDQQSAALRELNQIVRGTEQFRGAETAGKLVRLPTGDGMALAFFTSPDAPVRCALEIAEALKSRPEIKLRMGVDSGPVEQVSDVNDRSNVAGTGINMAQRVMDCGDASHILLSKRVAGDLAQYSKWQSRLHDLGEVEVKHGVKVSLVNLYTEDLGRRDLPEKLKRSRKEQAALATHAAAVRRRKVLGGAAAILLLAAAAITLWLYPRSAPTGNPASAVVAAIVDKSIAVLPFANLSANPENAFFADGVQDEILTNLAKVADLKVISRSSVMQYKADAVRNLRQVAQELGVAHILEGNVQRSGDQIRVNAQLIDARSDTHLWAQVYDRKVADLFLIQSEIAQTIAAQLQAKLSPKEKAAINQPPTANLAAYTLYLRAHEIWDKPPDPEPDMTEDLKKAEEWLTEAVKLDPNFVLAHCELARVYDLRYWYEIDQTPEGRARGDAAIETATRLAPTMGEVHLARGLHFYHGYREYGWARAEFELARKALPNEPRVYLYTCYLDRREGRWDEAIKNMERACALDPANVSTRFELADVYMCLHQYAEARRALSAVPATGVWGEELRLSLASADIHEKADFSGLRAVTPEKRPDGSVPLMNVSFAMFARDPDRAAQALAGVRAADFPPTEPRSRWEGAIARFRKDDATMRRAYGEARAEVAKALQARPEDPELTSVLGLLNANLGEKEEALRLGRRAIELLPLDHDAIKGIRLAVKPRFHLRLDRREGAGARGPEEACENSFRANLRRPSPRGAIRIVTWRSRLRGNRRVPRAEAIVKNVSPLAWRQRTQKIRQGFIRADQCV